MFYDGSHGIHELIERNHAVIVFVHFGHDVIPDYRASLCNMAATEDLLQLIFTNGSIAISI